MYEANDNICIYHELVSDPKQEMNTIQEDMEFVQTTIQYNYNFRSP